MGALDVFDDVTWTVHITSREGSTKQGLQGIAVYEAYEQTLAAWGLIPASAYNAVAQGLKPKVEVLVDQPTLWIPAPGSDMEGKLWVVVEPNFITDGPMWAFPDPVKLAVLV